MFRAGTTYKHKNMIDTCFLVNHALRLGSGDWILKIRWFRKDGLDFGLSERVRIKVEQLPNWRIHDV